MTDDLNALADRCQNGRAGGAMSGFRTGKAHETLASLLEKATVPANEWRTYPTERPGVIGIGGEPATTPKGSTVVPHIADVFGAENAALIVAAVNALPALIAAAQIERLPDPACARCGTTPIRDVLDGEPLCQSCCEAWARAEGQPS